MLLASLACTSRFAQKWVEILMDIQGFTSRTDWALQLDNLSLLGAFVKYPLLPPRVTQGLGFGRKLLCHVSHTVT